MEVTGKIINGIIVPDERIDWPEQTLLRISSLQDSTTGHPVLAGDAPPKNESVAVNDSIADDIPTLAQSLGDWIGSLDVPADFAAQHDHYIHGAKKRKS
jgi:hypothetical protein